MIYLTSKDEKDEKTQRSIRKIKNKKLAERLVNIGNQVVNQLEKQKNPGLDIPMRSLSNVYYDEKAEILRMGNKTTKRNYYNLNQAKNFMQTMLVASKLKDVIENGNTVGLRQLFYMTKGGIPGADENTFEEQKDCDTIIEDIEGLLSALREQIGIYADRKGILSGDLTLVDSGDEINCGKLGSSGYGIPSIVEKGTIDFVECNADFLLVVEKAQTWSRLNEDKFWKDNNCLILTGKGQPARGDRRMVARLHQELDLPVYVFTDMDIWGYYIYSVFKQGSINLAHFSSKSAVPEAKFLGVKTSDVEEFDIPKAHWIPMKQYDFKRISEIRDYDWFKDDKVWQKEFKALRDFGHVVEQDTLVAKGIDFMGEEYLPHKINNKDWLD